MAVEEKSKTKAKAEKVVNISTIVDTTVTTILRSVPPTLVNNLKFLHHVVGVVVF